MKKTSVLMVVIAALLLTATCVLAGPTTRIRADVPFSFHVGEELLPAGNYVFEMRAIGFGAPSSSAVAIYRQDGTLTTLLPTIPSGWEYQRMVEGHLHFTRYSDSYFLNKVEGPISAATLITTNAERELRVQSNHRSGTIIMAQRRIAQTQNP